MRIRKMINSTNIPNQRIKPTANVLFGVTKINPSGCGCNRAIVHEGGSGLFTLIEPGIYRVLFTANIKNTNGGRAIIDIETNGERLSESEIDTILTDDEFKHVMTFADVIVPCNSSKTVTIGNNSEIPLLMQNANIEIEKIY